MKRKKALEIINDVLKNIPEASDFTPIEFSTQLQCFACECIRSNYIFRIREKELKGEDKADFDITASVKDGLSNEEIAETSVSVRYGETWNKNDMLNDLVLVLKYKAEELERQIIKHGGTL